MALKILVAGIEKDERARIEKSVKQALGQRATVETWTVSLVKIASQWSITLNGPGERYRNLSFAVAEARIADAIAEALGDPHPGPVSSKAEAAGPISDQPSAPAPGARSEAHDRHTCEHCQKPFVVVYEAQSAGARELAAVACPHCWKLNRVEVDAWAAAGREYRADKA